MRNAKCEARDERVVIRQRQTNIETADTLEGLFCSRNVGEAASLPHTYTMNEKPGEGELLKGKALQRQFTNECGLLHSSQSIA